MAAEVAQDPNHTEDEPQCAEDSLSQEDGDGDRIGDGCDTNPTRADVRLSGQLITLGGRAVNDTHTLGGRATTGEARSSNQQFILQGRLSP